MRRSLLALLLLAGLAGPGLGATIAGHVFTAEHADSTAPHVPVTLIFRDAQDELQRLSAVTDAEGHFHFLDLSADTSIGYVLRIEHRGREFLGAPVRFAPGQTEIDWNVLLSEQAPPAGGLPEGHSPMPGSETTPRPAVQDPWHAVLIALWIALIFTVVALLARRRVEASARGSAVPPEARTLARDIASLDARRTEGVIGPEEYQKVRAGLVERLRAVSKGSGPR